MSETGYKYKPPPITRDPIRRKKKYRRLMKKQKGFCVYCNKLMSYKRDRPDSITFDHVVPGHHGGDGKKSNIVGACSKCNNEKGCKSLEEWQAEKR